MNSHKFITLLVLPITISCDYLQETPEVQLHCDIHFSDYRTIELYDLSPPVSIIKQIINDSEGNFFFTQYHDSVIGKLDSDGQFLEWIGRYGQGPGEFLSSYISMDKHDSLFVQDHLSQKITVYSNNELSNPHRIFSYENIYGDVILAYPRHDFIFQSFPLINMHSKQDSVFIFKVDKNGILQDTILRINGPELIIEKFERSLNVLHVADRRNITFQYRYNDFIVFENDNDTITYFDYYGSVLNKKSFTIPPVNDYSVLVERQFKLMSGISGDQLASKLQRLSNSNPPANKALYQEAIKFDDTYFFKLINNSPFSLWISYAEGDLEGSSKIYCHDNPTMTLKGFNGYYYYGLALTNDLEQRLYLMFPTIE